METQVVEPQLLNVWRLAEKNNIPLPHEHHVRKDLSS